MMHLKAFVKKIIVATITWQARLVIKKYRPRIVAITGSVGKTSTKEMITAVLAGGFKVRGSSKSFNSEFGVPLTILGLPTAWSNLWYWLINILRGFELLIFKHNYPEWLVLEVGADRPGDISNLAKWLSFDMVVLTKVPDVPVHVEFFRSAAQVVAEKLSLVNGLKNNGVIIVNADDPNLAGVLPTSPLQAKITFGFEKEAVVKGSHPHVVYRDHDGWKRPDGVACKVDYEGSNLPIRLPGVVAVHQLYGALAAFTVGAAAGLNPVSVVEALSHVVAPPGRMRLIDGIKNTLILDDTYNASPAAVSAALEMLGRIETTGKRIAVLGDMMELGDKTLEAHRQIGLEAATVSDVVVGVGLRARFILDAAREKNKADKNLKWFDDSRAAGLWLQNQLEPGDLVLVKGSQSSRMEKVVEEIMARPELKEELLCRQEPEWQER